jgi:hypothetical protein
LTDNSTAEKRPSRVYWVLPAALAIAYLASRLVSLMRLPAFTDEAVYIGWARETLVGNLAAGLADGKWLSIKIMSLFMLLPLHPLVAARSLSALAGLITLILCIATGTVLFSKREGLIAGLLLALLPFTLFHDRMALVDGMLTAWGAGILLLSILACCPGSRRTGWLLPLAIVAAVLSKSSAVFFLAIPVAAVLVLPPHGSRLAALARVAPALVCGTATFVFLMKTGSGSYQLGLTVLNGGNDGWTTIWRNLGLAQNWLWTWFTPPLAVLAVLSLGLFMNRTRRRPVIFLWLAGLSQVAAYVVTARVWYPRYLLFVAVPACLLMAGLLGAAFEAAVRPVWIRETVLGAAGVLLVLAWPLAQDIPIIWDPLNAGMPEADRFQYVTGWPSGCGLPELEDYLRQQAASAPAGLNVLNFSYWTPSYSGLNVYVSSSESLRLYGMDPFTSPRPAWASGLAQTQRTLVVLNGGQEAGNLKKIGRSLDDFLRVGRKLWEHPRPGSSTGLEVWEVLP